MRYTLFDDKGSERYISTADILDYDFKSRDEYIHYINESHLNGNRKQVQDLINDMAISQIVEMMIDIEIELVPFVREECIKAISDKTIGVKRVMEDVIKVNQELTQAQDEIKALKYSGPIRKKP